MITSRWKWFHKSVALNLVNQTETIGQLVISDNHVDFVEQTVPECPNSQMEITLTNENVANDIRLEIVEPSGENPRVYELNPNGAFGNLAMDLNRVGSRKYTYLTRCQSESLPTIVGQYHIYGNYYEGELSANAKLSIKIGEKTT